MIITEVMQGKVITMLESMNESPVQTIKMATGIVMVYGPSIDQMIEDLNADRVVEGLEILTEADVVSAIEEIYVEDYWIAIREDIRDQIMATAKVIYEAVCQYYIGVHNQVS